MKVFASDFDGTLSFDGKFKDEDLLKIKQFQNKGHLFGLCSGRPFLGIDEICKDYIDLDFYILCSGALILNKSHDVLFKSTISFDVLKRFYEQYKDKYEIYIQANFKIYSFKDEKLAGMTIQYITSIDEVKGDIYGISMFALSEENARAEVVKIESMFDELTVHQNKQFLDICERGCSKGLGIKKLQEYYNIDMIAGIGDSYNDIPMLEVVDHAFTFHFSPDEVKEKVDDVVDSVAEAIDILLEE